MASAAPPARHGSGRGPHGSGTGPVTHGSTSGPSRPGQGRCGGQYPGGRGHSSSNSSRAAATSVVPIVGADAVRASRVWASTARAVPAVTAAANPAARSVGSSRATARCAIPASQLSSW